VTVGDNIKATLMDRVSTVGGKGVGVIDLLPCYCFDL